MAKYICKISSVSHYGDLTDMILEDKNLASESKKGQFLHIACGGDTFLRRPISICDADANKGTTRIIFQTRGHGTELLAAKKTGDEVDVLGPLGHGFESPESGKVLLIGGGIGTFPLLMAAKELGDRAVVVIGYRTKELMYPQLIADFEAVGAKVCIATDDGSYGTKGNVVTVFDNLISEGEKVSAVMTCGPMIMMKFVAKAAEKYGIPCQVSLEERMGCGIGTCLCCVADIKEHEHADPHHLCVCKDGPVFDAKKVVFE